MARTGIRKRLFVQPLKATLVVLILVSPFAVCPEAGGAPPVYRIDHVVDGDTVALRNGQRVRLVQIDTPEVFFGVECYGRAASLQTKRLLHPGSRVRLFAEPATDRVDQYGRLLRYVVRINGALNVNIRLVAVGAAAPYFYRGRRGRYARRLEALAKRARARKLGLWKACPRTPYDPYEGIQTRR
jgi:endonuclease YncB( thermonuclease family)